MVYEQPPAGRWSCWFLFYKTLELSGRWRADEGVTNQRQTLVNSNKSLVDTNRPILTLHNVKFGTFQSTMWACLICQGNAVLFSLQLHDPSPRWTGLSEQQNIILLWESGYVRLAQNQEIIGRTYNFWHISFNYMYYANVCLIFHLPPSHQNIVSIISAHSHGGPHSCDCPRLTLPTGR